MKSSNTLVSWVILSVLVLVWGSSFILIKKSLIYFTGNEVGLLRIVITFLFLLPLSIKSLKNTPKRLYFLFFISGIVGSLFPAFFFAIAETHISSSLAGTLNSLTPLFTLIIGILFFKLRAHWFNILGVVIGLIGAVGLINATSGVDLTKGIAYSSLVILASICYAVNVNLVKFFFKEINSMDITTLTFFFIGIPALFYLLLFTDIPHKLIYEPQSWKGFGYMAILSIAGTGLALIIFNYLIKISTPVFASSVTYVIPVVAILWGVFDGETFKWTFLFWVFLILAGVFLVNKQPLEKKK
jgi:drug/metabolite transporter (DMT)-like permease